MTWGLERDDCLGRAYFWDARIAIICFDVTNKKSFRSCSHWLEQLRIAEYDACPNCIVLASGNKTDLVDKRQVSTDEARKFFSSLDPPIPYFETSALTRKGVDELFEAALQCFFGSQNENTPADGNAQGGWCTVS